MAGSLKFCNPSLNEDIILVQALRDSNIPKFLAEDSDIFQVRIFSNLAQINNIGLGKMAYVVFTNCVFECYVLFLMYLPSHTVLYIIIIKYIQYHHVVSYFSIKG
jgi:hypothetical protein